MHAWPCARHISAGVAAARVRHDIAPTRRASARAGTRPASYLKETLRHYGNPRTSRLRCAGGRRWPFPWRSNRRNRRRHHFRAPRPLARHAFHLEARGAAEPRLLLRTLRSAVLRLCRARARQERHADGDDTSGCSARRAWRVSLRALFAGLFIGTIACGFLADRFGRRAIFTYSLLWYTAANVIMAFQDTRHGAQFLALHRRVSALASNW